MKSPKKYITERSDNWFVRIRTNEGRKVKCFSFNKWGGKCAAFLLALKWRNEMLTKYDLWERINFEKSPDIFAGAEKVQPIIGVYQTNSSGNINWCAHFQINHLVTKRHFSINKYGDKTAFLKACKIRFKNSGKLIVINRDALPCRPDVPYKFHKAIEV